MTVSQSLFSLTTPGQVWPHLSAERQHQAIRCLAQLALNVVTAEADRVLLEVPHEHPDSTTQIAR